MRAQRTISQRLDDRRDDNQPRNSDKQSVINQRKKGRTITVEILQKLPERNQRKQQK